MNEWQSNVYHAPELRAEDKDHVIISSQDGSFNKSPQARSPKSTFLSSFEKQFPVDEEEIPEDIQVSNSSNFETVYKCTIYYNSCRAVLDLELYLKFVNPICQRILSIMPTRNL